jgi:hypothetical protein
VRNAKGYETAWEVIFKDAIRKKGNNNSERNYYLAGGGYVVEKGID